MIEDLTPEEQLAEAQQICDRARSKKEEVLARFQKGHATPAEFDAAFDEYEKAKGIWDVAFRRFDNNG